MLVLTRTGRQILRWDAGVVTTQVGPTDFFGGVALQGDGKIVVSGEVGATTGPTSLGVLRYNSDGTLDTSFGTGGVETVTSPGSASINGLRIGNVIQADGKIIAGGKLYDGATQKEVLAALRVNPDGTVDSSYGSGGWATVEFRGGSLDASHSNQTASS